MEDPPKKFFRLAPGREVRLRYAYLVTCTRIERDPDSGDISTVYCSYDPLSRGGNAPDGRKVKGTIHWVSAGHAKPAVIRLYDRLFNIENPAASEDFRQHLNDDSVKEMSNAMLEPSLGEAIPGASYQFERLGYFCADLKEHRADKLVFNRTATLRDTWAKSGK